jgi:hypothetical protein
MRRPGLLRAQALFLCLTLLLGGFGLPLLDAAWFHSTAAPGPDPLEIALQGQHNSGVAHALGCAVLTSAASGRGLPVLGSPVTPESPRSAGPTRELRLISTTSTDVTLSLPRAPPSA